MAVFVNGDASKAAGLVANIQKLEDSRKDKGLKTFVVFMQGPEAKPAIEKIAADQHTTKDVPLVFLPRGTGERDVSYYKVNPQAKNTILLWRQETVKKNFADVDEKTFPEVEKAVDEMLK